jgi:hypothetical protein
MIYTFLKFILAFYVMTSSAIVESAPSQAQKINLLITVDYEGYNLDPENIAAFIKFREEFPNIKVVHFLNPAYFLQPGADPIFVQKTLQSLIRPGDELGLHIHALKTLLDAASVEFRDPINFWGRKNSVAINGVLGHDVPLSIFTEQEIEKIVKTSIEILSKYGFTDLKSFRAGGWVAPPSVLNAVAKYGIKVDSSPVPAEFIKNFTGPDSPIYQIVSELWPNAKVGSTSAYEINTAHGKMVQCVNNFCLADWLSAKGAYAEFEDLMNKAYGKSKGAINVVYGGHTETAAEFFPQISKFINNLMYDFPWQLDIRSKTLNDIVRTGDYTGESCQILF